MRVLSQAEKAVAGLQEDMETTKDQLRWFQNQGLDRGTLRQVQRPIEDIRDGIAPAMQLLRQNIRVDRRQICAVDFCRIHTVSKSLNDHIRDYFKTLEHVRQYVAETSNLLQGRQGPSSEELFERAAARGARAVRAGASSLSGDGGEASVLGGPIGEENTGVESSTSSTTTGSLDDGGGRKNSQSCSTTPSTRAGKKYPHAGEPLTPIFV